MDTFKKETVAGCTVFDINAKCVRSKYRSSDYRIVVRAARRKAKNNLKNSLDKNDIM